MSSNILPDLSPEFAHAHKIAAKEMIKYCKEFYRWRTPERISAGPDYSVRMQRMQSVLATKQTNPEKHRPFV